MLFVFVKKTIVTEFNAPKIRRQSQQRNKINCKINIVSQQHDECILPKTKRKVKIWG